MTKPLNREDVAKVSDWLKSQSITFVVVGGSAIELLVDAATHDVDVLILVGDWGKISKAVSESRVATPLEPEDGQLRGTSLNLGGLERIDLEFISAEPFCGHRSPDEFVEYVQNYRSRRVAGARYADPSVVWYIRLSIDNLWEAYVSKIQRDIVAGIPESTFETVLEIAEKFGVKRKLKERIEGARKLLKLFPRG
jgi:hypothetical protein